MTWQLLIFINGKWEQAPDATGLTLQQAIAHPLYGAGALATPDYQ